MSARFQTNFLWTLLGSIVSAACQWLLVVFLSKHGAQLTGDWTLALGITAPIFIFLQLKLRTVVAADTEWEYSWAAYAKTRLVAMGLAFVVSLGFAAMQSTSQVMWTFAIVAATRCCDGFSELLYGTWQRNLRMDAMAVSQMLRWSLALAFATLAYLLTSDIACFAAGVLAAHVIGLIRDWRIAVRYGTAAAPLTELWRFPAARIKPLVLRTLPLGLVTTLGALQLNIPRYFLDGFVSRADVGIFSANTHLLLFGGLVISALGSAAIPEMARLAQAKQFVQFRRRLLALCIAGTTVGAFATLCCWLFAEPVLRFVYSEQFAQHAWLMVWMALATTVAWTYHFLGTALDALRYYRIQPYIYGVSTAVLALGCWLWVPNYQMKGAVWAILVAYGIETILYIVAVTTVIRRKTRE